MTTTNTGTCPCCFGTFVVKKGLMVLHGYKRPGVGYIIGNCPATRTFKPFEVSSEGTVFMRNLAVAEKKRLVAYLNDLHAEKVLEFTKDFPRDGFYNMSARQKRSMLRSELYETVTFRKGDGKSYKGVDYASLLGFAIRNTDGQIKTIQQDIDFLNQKIVSWKPVDVAAKNAEAAKAEAAEQAKLCPGSGTIGHHKFRRQSLSGSGHGYCNLCGRWVVVSSRGVIRKHEPKVKKVEA